ncbi:uncharacterized protein V6R79_007690 [Siganus canaliculatus]
MASEMQSVPRLEVEAVIGFNGHVLSGLSVHPDGEHLIYPLGCTVILKRIKDGKQELLQGHTNNVSCISVSKSGSHIASGQVNFTGFEAMIIIWDYAQRAIYAQLLLHKAKVEALTFSPDEKYLVSLGGQEDGSIVVWNVETKQAICTSPASPRRAGHSFTVQYSNTNNNIFISAGSETVRVWELNLTNRKIEPTECKTGNLKRIVKCLEISTDDEFIFCGTTSGDIMKINLKTRFMTVCGPVKKMYDGGVNVLKTLNSGNLLVGSGAGIFALCSDTNFKLLKKAELGRGVTSIALKGEGQQFFVGTEAAQMYRFSYEDFKAELISTNHSSAILDIALCVGTSELFATCSKEDIRVWHTPKAKELLHIVVPNLTCNSVAFMPDACSIISAWNDGCIRVNAPQSGRLMQIFHNAHKLGVTAIAGTWDSKKIVSGGEEGQVRVWEVQPQAHRLLEILHGHKAAVTCIIIKSDDKEFVSAGSDGSCIIWDLVRRVTLRSMIVRTQFRTVCYHPEEYQIITSGTDRKVAYWEPYEGPAIREVEGSQSGAINGMHISQDGDKFVTGGDDMKLKVWDYMKGVVTHVGVGHGSSITSVKFCSDNSTVISCSTDGAIILWKLPQPLPH